LNLNLDLNLNSDAVTNGCSRRDSGSSSSSSPSPSLSLSLSSGLRSRSQASPKSVIIRIIHITYSHKGAKKRHKVFYGHVLVSSFADKRCPDFRHRNTRICPAVQPSDRYLAFTGYWWLSAGYQDILTPFP